MYFASTRSTSPVHRHLSHHTAVAWVVKTTITTTAAAAAAAATVCSETADAQKQKQSDHSTCATPTRETIYHREVLRKLVVAFKHVVFTR